MRRADREVTEPQEIADIMQRCEVVRLALNTETVPYILPVNFGMEEDGMTLYIHGAMDGTKYEHIARDSRASFEMDCSVELDLENGECTMSYESVIGWGVIDELTEPEEKHHALNRLMQHYRGVDFPYDEEAISITRILRLRVQERTGKRRRKMM